MKRKTLEELKLDLIEIRAYRDLQDAGFCFDGVNEIKNESKVSEDAYYENLEDNILDSIDNTLYQKRLTKRKKKMTSFY